MAGINSCTLDLFLVLHGNEGRNLGVLTSSLCVCEGRETLPGLECHRCSLGTVPECAPFQHHDGKLRAFLNFSFWTCCPGIPTAWS